MTFQFKGFSATKPVVRLIDKQKFIYQVFFIVYDASGKKHQKRYQKEFNQEKVKNRRSSAEVFADTLWLGLHRGWNPLQTSYPFFEEEQSRDQHTLMTGMQYALSVKKKELSKYSYPDYSGAVRFLEKAAKECGMLDTLIKTIQRKDIRLLVATAKEQRGWSNKSRNKHLTKLKSLFSVLVDADILPYNPAHNIRDEAEEKTLGYKRLTQSEQQRVVDHLSLNAPAFFEYVYFIYQDGIRRKETLMLQVRDFNLQDREITIRPEVAKTNTERIVPITDDLMQILVNREIWSLPKDWYLFSNNKFLPGPEMYHPNIPTTWWRNLIIKGICISCKMYSLKHKGADDKIRSGISLEALKNLYGHRSTQMTEIYAAAVRDQHMKQIIDKAPGMGRVVQMKKEA